MTKFRSYIITSLILAPFSTALAQSISDDQSQSQDQGQEASQVRTVYKELSEEFSTATNPSRHQVAGNLGVFLGQCASNTAPNRVVDTIVVIDLTTAASRHDNETFLADFGDQLDRVDQASRDEWVREARDSEKWVLDWVEPTRSILRDNLRRHVYGEDGAVTWQARKDSSRIEFSKDGEFVSQGRYLAEMGDVDRSVIESGSFRLNNGAWLVKIAAHETTMRGSEVTGEWRQSAYCRFDEKLARIGRYDDFDKEVYNRPRQTHAPLSSGKWSGGAYHDGTPIYPH
jgi:hypothetical protein